MESRDGLNFGRLLKRRRRSAGLTQEALAERASFSPHYISMLERGVRLPPPVTVDLFADALALASEERRSWHAAAALRPREPSRPRPLRTPLTPLLGRDRESARIASLLRHDGVRLLTITGPGGVGKTCLAQYVAATIAPDFPGGCVVVDLASVRDVDAVLPAIARALGVRDSSRSPRAAGIIAVLQSAKRLLLLDSVERVVAAAPEIGTLLDACPRLAILATSRAPLRLRHEQEFSLPPLALPDGRRPIASSVLAESPAVALFLHRARMVAPDLVTTDADLMLVAEICRRVDGLPLAIELAAARLKHLSLSALRDRIARRLEILSGGPGDLPVRQQRMRDTIAWSFDLLAPDEQSLFGQLSIFAGGWTLQATEIVCTLDSGQRDALEGLRVLVDQSLVVFGGGVAEPRYWMLDTIRDYAAERLRASGDAERMGRRHAEYFLGLAEQAAPALHGHDQDVWVRRLAHEHDNLRDALHWLVENGEATRALRLAGALWRFWQRNGDVRDGRRWLESTLAAAPDAPPEVRGMGLWGASWLALQQGDYARGRAQPRVSGDFASGE